MKYFSKPKTRSTRHDFSSPKNHLRRLSFMEGALMLNDKPMRKLMWCTVCFVQKETFSELRWNVRAQKK